MASLNKNLEKLKQLDLDNDRSGMKDHVNSIISGYIDKEKYVTCEDVIKFAANENLSIYCLMYLSNATNDHKDKIDRTSLFDAIKKKTKINKSFDIEKIILKNK